jgi:hypothetical protein
MPQPTAKNGVAGQQARARFVLPRTSRDELKSHEEETMKLAKAVIGVLALLTMVSPLTAQKGGGASDVRLRVSIADRSTTEDYRVESDGGEYVDGEQGVSARLDRYGDLIVNFQVDPRNWRRQVRFDYSCTANPDTTVGACAPRAEPPSGLQDRAYISTVCREVFTGFPCSSPKIQEMAVGTEQCVQLNWEFTDVFEQHWRNGFHRNRDLPLQEGTAYGVVTRTGDDTWTVEPRAASCQGDNMPGIARTFRIETVRSKFVFNDFGTFWLPFNLTLTRMTN